MDSNFNYLCEDILNIRQLYKDNRIKKPDIVSEVGLNEYRELNDMKIWFSQYVKPIMSDDGIFITTQMKERHGAARLAMDRTGWILIYKETEELQRIVTESGFDILESGRDYTGLHSYVVVRKMH